MSGFLWGVLCGLFAGAALGIVAMAVVSVNRADDRDAP